MALAAVWTGGCLHPTAAVAASGWPPWEPYHVTAGRISVERTRVMGVACYLARIPAGPTGCFVTFVMAGSPGAHAPFRRLLHRSPVAPRFGLTGTFFDKKTWRPVGSIIVDGQQLHAGGTGHALCVAPDKTVFLRETYLHRAMDTIGVRSALRSGPRMVQARRLLADYRAQGFRDPRVVSAMAPRCGVGVRRQGAELVALVVLQPIQVKTFGRLFLTLGCQDALNLDGGGSVALFGKGRVIYGPGRELTNIVVAF